MDLRTRYRENVKRTQESVAGIEWKGHVFLAYRATAGRSREAVEPFSRRNGQRACTRMQERAAAVAIAPSVCG